MAGGAAFVLLAFLAISALYVHQALGQEWVESFAGDSGLPTGAVVAGYSVAEADMLVAGKRIATYVARTYCKGHIAPCKVDVNPKVSSAWCAVNADGCSSAVFEVLTVGANAVVSWYPASNGDVPDDAIPTGVTSSGEPLYTCRVVDTKVFGLVPGTLQPSLKNCYIEVSGTRPYPVYEVLIIK